MRLCGATALVTGAAQGLGKAFSEALLLRGASVCLSDVQEIKGKETEVEFQKKYGRDKAMFVKCDVKNEENMSEMFQKVVSQFGHIDLLVNNAGIASESNTKDMVDINLVAVIRGTEFAVNHMRKDKGGRGGVVINIASAAGLYPTYFMPSYSATKFGVIGLTSSWASNPHVKEFDIQFASVCPAFTDTAILAMDEKNVIYLDEAEYAVQKMGINTVDTVVKAFMMLVESDNCNGDIVTITKRDGINYRQKGGKSVKSSL